MVDQYFQVDAYAFNCVEYVRALGVTVQLKYWSNDRNSGELSPEES